MRKRRFPNASATEALSTLKTSVNAAYQIQQRLPASTQYPGPRLPDLPEQFSALNDQDSLSKLSDEDLEQLKAELPALLTKVTSELQDWEELGKHLRSALDAALLIYTLKPESDMPKRRRTGTPHDEPPPVEDKAAPEDSAAEEPVPEPPLPQIKEEAPGPVKNAPAQGGSLAVGRQVAFKVPKSAVDEWIQCEIIKVISPGTRFEVRDPEPDDDGNPGKTYNARLRDIMPLPVPGQTIKPVPPSSVVFARYPDTTAFYKAKVTRYSAKKGVYYLRFEGEDDAHKEIEVSAMLVIPTIKGRR